jgi:hypothetical protein
MAKLKQAVLAKMAPSNAKAAQAAAKLKPSQRTAPQKAALKAYNQRLKDPSIAAAKKSSATTGKPTAKPAGMGGGKQPPLGGKYPGGQAVKPEDLDMSNADPWMDAFGMYGDPNDPMFAGAGSRGPGSAEAIMDDPAGLAKALGMMGYTGSVDEMLSQALLGQQWAGREQWGLNTTGNTGAVEANPSLQNTRTAIDRSAINMLLGTLQTEMQAGRDPKALFQGRNQYVPGFASNMFKQQYGGSPLMQQINEVSGRGSSLFNIEPLMSAEINVRDPSKPLFGPGQHPVSLFNATGFQSGEEDFYRTMSAEEFMRQIMPQYNAYFNRPAGAPVPQGMEGGFMMGSPWLNPQTGEYSRSPAMSSPAYQRYQAYGYPRAPDNNLEGVYGPDPNPAGVATGWQGWTAPYAPNVVDPAFLARLQSYMGTPVAGGGQGFMGPGGGMDGGGGMGPSPQDVAAMLPEDMMTEEELMMQMLEV